MPSRFIDKKFPQFPGRYFVQSALAGLSIMLLMVLHHHLESDALLASLGASTFTVFTVPHAKSARSKCLIGGYVCGVLSGLGFRLLLASGWFAALDGAAVRVAAAGLGVGMAMLLMVLLQFEHPPAAGIALGLVIGPWCPWNILYVMAAITALALVRGALRHYMRDLA
ncbi:MAG: HPP family protein [Planctomycetes bacterium]|nr:HPP family protein [Planctomycetota bacterium]